MSAAGGCLTWCSATQTRRSCTGCPRSSTPRLWAAPTDPSPGQAKTARAGGWLGGWTAGHELAAGVLIQAVEEPVGDGQGAVVGVAGQGEAADQHVQACGGGGVLEFVRQVGLLGGRA